jgi:hypothetical protein
MESMAPVMAIANLVASAVAGWLFDPLGRFSKPFVTGPNPIRISLFRSKRWG